MEDQRRIAVISEDLAEPWDEGIKKFAFSTASALRDFGEVIVINVDRSGVGGREAERIPGSRTFLSARLASKLRGFSPHYLIYVPSPSSTLASFWRCGVLRAISPKAALGMVAMIPRRHSSFWKPFLRFTAPDLVFVPSYASLLALSRLSLKGEIIPMGVDEKVFHAPSLEEKRLLREKYGFSRDSFLFLHVGHLSYKRNLLRLCSLSHYISEAEVVIVSSTSTREERSLRVELENAGARIIREYVKVEEFYRLADCYVFPVEQGEGSIEMPLSVLEALASGLPVLTTRFGGLVDFLPEGPDVIYWEQASDLVQKAKQLIQGGKPETRSMQEFSWHRIASLLLEKLGS